MPDSVGQQYIVQVLVDDGYAEDEKFIKPDDTDEHRQYRAYSEHYFARLAVQWKAVGDKDTHKQEIHTTHVRNAFVLTNMNIVDNGA